MNTLYQHGVTEALQGFGSGAFTAAEYLESCIDRCAAVEPRIAAFAHLEPDAIRLRLASAAKGGPLTAIPVGVKDIIATAGIPTGLGVTVLKGHLPDASAWVVERLATLGAVLFGKTVSTELAWRSPGKTRNPWQLDHTPGGSSSGSAAAVASGCVPVALGTQTLGSVIRPSAFCGVVGYKPSFGRIPRTGVHPLAPSLDHVGVHARSVGDAALVAGLLTGHDGLDFGLGSAPEPAWPLAVPDGPLHIALLRTSAWSQVQAEQQALVESTAARLAKAGAVVTELDLPAVFEQVWGVAEQICEAEAAAVNGPLVDRYGDRISAAMRETVSRGRAQAAPAYVKARELQQAMITAYARTLAPFDAALTAATLGEAPQGLANTGNPLFCTPFSVVGAPAITLPAGRSAAGLPLAIQLVGGWNRDRRLLEAALWVEQLLDYRPGFPLLG